MKLYMRTWAGKPSAVGYLPDTASDNSIKETAAAALSVAAVPVSWSDIEVLPLEPAVSGFQRRLTRKNRPVGVAVYQKDPRNA